MGPDLIFLSQKFTLYILSAVLEKFLEINYNIMSLSQDLEINNGRNMLLNCFRAPNYIVLGYFISQIIGILSETVISKSKTIILSGLIQFFIYGIQCQVFLSVIRRLVTTYLILFGLLIERIKYIVLVPFDPRRIGVLTTVRYGLHYALRMSDSLFVFCAYKLQKHPIYFKTAALILIQFSVKLCLTLWGTGLSESV